MTKLLPVLGLACLSAVAAADTKPVADAKPPADARAPASDRKPYTMDDLKVLIQQKSYAEFIAHAADVAPSERKGEWLDMLAQAGAGTVEAAERDDKLDAMVAVEKAFPVIVTQAKYAAARSAQAGTAFDACFDKGSDEDDRRDRRTHRSFLDCRDLALKFIDADPKNAKVALDLAKATRRGMSSYGAVPAFKRALAAAGTTTKPVCKDEDFKIAVISGLSLLDDDARLGESVALTYACWDDIKGPLMKELTEDSGDFHDRACDLFASKKTPLPADKERLCSAPRAKK